MIPNQFENLLTERIEGQSPYTDNVPTIEKLQKFMKRIGWTK